MTPSLKQSEDMKKILRKGVENCNVHYKVLVTTHFSDRVLERKISYIKLIRFINYIIPRYCFLILLDKTFAFQLNDSFVILGEFCERKNKYVLTTVLSCGMVPNNIKIFKKFKY